MSYPNAIEVCRAELFTKEVELRDRYPQALVDKMLRVREMYNWFIDNPDGTDAFDTLYIGAEKFPYHDTFALSVSGVSYFFVTLPSERLLPFHDILVIPTIQ
ncbi:MAG: hypothetical protein HDS81_00740 [Bacteroidales bacterium]|nr:hypothetical protein [Bacteroidales bacterium]MBD5252700.1 hypothetical protein [Barnesiella sp.]